jgi:hypothetical protein
MKKDVKNMSENFADCEVCGEYCGDRKYKARLLVEIPDDLQDKLDKSHAWLCFKCVRKHCFDTIGGIKYDDDGVTPLFDKKGIPIRSDYWCKLIFGPKRSALRFEA